MTKYRKRPTEVEAWQVGSDESMPEWVESCRVNECGTYSVRVRGCIMYVCEAGDWIVLDAAQGVSLCVKPGVFEQTYEVVE